MGFTAYGTSWRPKRYSRIFSSRYNARGNTLLLKMVSMEGQTHGIYTLFQTKMAKSIPYFRPEMLEIGTLWGGTYLYGLYMEVYGRGGGGVKPKASTGLPSVINFTISSWKQRESFVSARDTIRLHYGSSLVSFRRHSHVHNSLEVEINTAI